MKQNWSVCNIKTDEKSYLKDRTVCKCCYKKNRRKNTLIHNQQPKSIKTKPMIKRKEKLLTVWIIIVEPQS